MCKQSSKTDLVKKFVASLWFSMILSERTCQEEQNGANFSFVALSSEELRVRKEFDENALL